MRRLFLVALMVILGGVANAGGADIFNSHCAICHRPNAEGVPGMYPPLADSIGSYVATPAGRAYLVRVISFGMTGPISVHGQTYYGMMQPWPKLTDEDLAQVLNYILTTFNTKLLPKDFSPLTSDEVKKYRNANRGLGDIRKQREALRKAPAAHKGTGS